MLAAPFGEQRMVGTADMETTKERSSCGISEPMIRSIYVAKRRSRYLLGIGLRIADERVDVMLLESEQTRLQSNAAYIAVVDLRSIEEDVHTRLIR